MSKALNAALIDGLEAELQDVESLVVIDTSAMNVGEVSALRKKMREQDFKMRVVKNTLAGETFKRLDWDGLTAVLNGPSALVFGGEGAIAISKLIVEEKKTAKEKLLIHGALNEGDVLDEAGVNALSKVPGRKELLAMTMAGFFGPVSNMAQNMDGLFSEMHGLIEALEKKQSEG